MASRTIRELVGEQEVRTLTPDDSAHAAAKVMSEHNISAVIVVDADGRLAGIVTERDLTRRVVAPDALGSDILLSDIMTAHPEVTSPLDSVTSALQHMRGLGVRHLPVVDEGAVVGVVSIRDLQDSVTTQVVAI